MKTTPHSVWQRCLPVMIFLVAAMPLQAQSVTTPQTTASANAPADKSEIVELSPFVVNAEKETGYQAVSTLAGTRLNTAVQDIAASVSIYTKDFLEDVGVTNLNELMVFATGMEAGGEGGNYFGGSNDMFADNLSSDGPRASPQTSRTRGLATATYTRGYFATKIPSDTYNSGAVTVIRGPNAALFGVGSPAGVIDTTPNGAELTRNKATVRARYGNNGGFRGAVDINAILAPKTLALRVATLYDNEKYDQKPAFEEQKRIYGALIFEPTKTTTFRARAESGKTTANRPITYLPYNSISDAWYAAGRPSFDWRYYDDPALNPNARTQAAQNFEPVTMDSSLIPGIMVVYANAGDTTPAYAFPRALTLTGGSDPNAVKSQLFHPLVNRDLAGDQIRFLHTINIYDMPATYWSGTNVPAGQQPGYQPAGIMRQGFANFSAFDFKNRMLDETSRQGDSFDSFNISFEQRAWKNRVGVELVYDLQKYHKYSKNSFFSSSNAQHIFIDTNVTLPNGQPNPNLGRPFALCGQGPWQQVHDKSEGLRATGYLRYDFRDISLTWGKWLGQHTITGLYEESRVTTVDYRYRLAVLGEASEMLYAGPINASNRQARAVVYMGPSIIGNGNALKLEPITGNPIVAGPTSPVTYFSRAGNDTDPGGFIDSPASFTEVLHSGNAQRDFIRSEAVVLHSYWLQSHVVTMLSWRRDRDYFVREELVFTENPNDRNDPGKVHYNLGDFSFPSKPPPLVTDEIMSYGAVVHWPQQWVKLPLGSELSVFYNESSNFTPSAGRVNAFGETLDSPKGETREYGVNLSLFNNKLSMRLNVFKTSIVGASLTPSFYSAAVANAVIQTAATWLEEANSNPQLGPQREADVKLLFDALPENFRDLYGFKVSGESPNIVVTHRSGNLSGLSDTTDYTARGLEMDLVCNPTRNLRIALNVAKQETIKNNSVPFMKQWVERMGPVWAQVAHTPKGSYPTDFQLGDPLPANVLTYGDWLDAEVFVPLATTLASEGVASAEQRKWRVNFICAYTFGANSIFGDKLRGWRVGGSVRWQDKVAIGYPITRNTDGSVNIDIGDPYYGPTETNVNAWLSYSFKLWNKVQMTVKLDVQNLIRGDDLIPVSVQGWNGQVAGYRLAPPRRWYLECQFNF